MSEPIAKPLGLLWFSACILFIIAGIFFLLDKSIWWKLALAAVLLSQIVIFTSWKDAKFGTIANFIILAYIFYFLFS